MLSIIVLTASLLVAPALADLETVTSSGRDRTYWVHEPDDFEDGQTYPTIIAFHGSSGIGFNIDGFAMEADVRLSLPVVRTAYSSDVSISPQINLVQAVDKLIAILHLSRRCRRLLGRPDIRQRLRSRGPTVRKRPDRRHQIQIQRRQ
jgi:hypothetical protein